MVSEHRRPIDLKVRVIRSTIVLEFEWNEDKEAINRREHGVAFHDAIKTFRDPLGWNGSMLVKIMAKSAST